MLLRQGYYKDEPEYLSGKKPKGAVKIRTAQAQKIGDEMSTTFLIATKDRNMKVRCDSHAGGDHFRETKIRQTKKQRGGAKVDKNRKGAQNSAKYQARLQET